MNPDTSSHANDHRDHSNGIHMNGHAKLSSKVIPSSRATIHEIHSMSSILPSILSEHTHHDDDDEDNESVKAALVVFDIDNTLLEPVGHLGSDQWYYHIVNMYRSQYPQLEPQAIERKADELWNQCQHNIQVKPVESAIPELIQSLRDKNVITMALTARCADIMDITLQQLSSIHIHMTDSNKILPIFHKHQHDKNNNNIIRISRHDIEGANDDIAYKDGVVFAGSLNDKGVILAHILKQMSTSIHRLPKKVVFVDDRQSHVQSVYREMQKMSIDVECFRYGGADSKVKIFNELVKEAIDFKTANLFFLGNNNHTTTICSSQADEE